MPGSSTATITQRVRHPRRPRAGAPSARERGCNHVRLLENGEQFFPRVLKVIGASQREVLLETFILFEDNVGKALHGALIAAARRGVEVDVTVDGYGSPNLSQDFVDALTSAGVRLRVFDPCPQILGIRSKMFRRLHRKLLVVDGVRAFIGGINFSVDQLTDSAPSAKRDYAVELEGPIVAEIHTFMKSVLAMPTYSPPRHRNRVADAGSGTQAQLVVRDNARHRDDIEVQYRAAIHAARREVIIANAYFFPGYRLLRSLRDTARRGVRVSLLLQGESDKAYAAAAARMLYRYLTAGGVRIYEYCERPFHGKVAVVDDDWATVGSSNLDPLSLALNLEANVVIRDARFTAQLRERLTSLINRECRLIDPARLPRSTFWRTLSGFALFHVLRRFPAWAGLLPAHTPTVALIEPPAPATEAPCVRASRWRWIGRGFLALFAGVVALLLLRYARGVDWPAVAAAIAQYDRRVLMLAGMFSATSYLIYSGYDVLARRYARHTLSTRRTMAIAFVSYAFNLNLGALIGGAGFRYRLYSRSGLPARTIARIVAFSVATNWLGYIALAGCLFAARAVPVPASWKVGTDGLQAMGFALLAVTATYFVLCGLWHERTWMLREHEIRLPSPRLAFLQLALSVANWLTIAVIVFVLLRQQIAFPVVLGVFLLGAIAGAIAHIPAGLGVIEVVFITLLGGTLRQHDLVAALLAYRAVYYIAPLLIALALYAGFEGRARRSHAPPHRGERRLRSAPTQDID
jgi:cardiolipin synthase A/B